MTKIFECIKDDYRPIKHESKIYTLNKSYLTIIFYFKWRKNWNNWYSWKDYDYFYILSKAIQLQKYNYISVKL